MPGERIHSSSCAFPALGAGARTRACVCSGGSCARSGGDCSQLWGSRSALTFTWSLLPLKSLTHLD